MLNLKFDTPILWLMTLNKQWIILRRQKTCFLIELFWKLLFMSSGGIYFNGLYKQENYAFFWLATHQIFLVIRFLVINYYICQYVYSLDYKLGISPLIKHIYNMYQNSSEGALQHSVTHPTDESIKEIRTISIMA